MFGKLSLLFSFAALIENVHSSSVGRREVRVSKFNEANEARGPVNSITVSKKRNWLQQSSSKGQVAEDILVTVTAEEDPCNVSNPPCPSSEEHRQPPVVPSVGHRKPLRPQPAHVTVTQAGTASHRLARPSLPQPRAVDPAEENDADDEGEIWYNPIPEDEEPELSRGTMAEWRPSAQMEPQAPAAGQRKLSVGDGIRGSGCTPSSSDSLVDCKGAPAAEVNHTSSTHSMERTQLHRQKFVCKAGDENTGPRPLVADATCTSNTGFSPPPSPNPSKKGSSINWSFPDKIKSPRTVRKLSMKMKKLPELSRKLKSSQGHNPLLSPTGGSTTTATTTTAASRNVISRYHLDSSVSTQQSYNKKKSSGASKSASKGGYLSDGDSPELVAKSGKHGSDSKAGKCKEPPNGGAPKLHGTEIDIDAFRHYSFSEQPKCSQYISGLMSVHFYGAEDLKPPRLDSRDVYCAIQVDSVNKARTALLTCRTSFLDMDHTFNIELENAQHLKLVVFSWEPTPRRNRVCCHGTVLEPRGMIYVKLTLMEQWQNSLDSPDGEREPAVFGVEAWRVVERENAGLVVPLLIEKCITEIEKRGCQVVGLYRLCGSAAVKKELREAFERDSKAVEISENQYPDINVITAAGPGVGCDRSSRSQYVRRRRERPQVLNLSEVDMAGVLRPRPGRLDSPSNRYAGDWSRCGESYFQPPSDNTEGEADYDDVPSEDAGSTEEVVEDDEREEEEEGRGDLQESIDTLIGNLERELNKNKLNVGY
ncbi:SYDE2 protein, partial [Amia calva]|nr:SYDE2 protein [Amia calva]